MKGGYKFKLEVDAIIGATGRRVDLEGKYKEMSVTISQSRKK